MSTQQDIYVVGFENQPPMLNKENYVPWSSCLLRYAKNREVTVNPTFHEQTDDELTEKELKQIEGDDQAIQTIILGHPEDIYAAVDSCETTQEIWLRLQQMMKGSDIEIQEKKAKFFNEWERFTSTDRESTKSYYHHFSKLMNNFNRNKHFPEKIANNLKFLNNLQSELSRHVTINVGNQNGLIVVLRITNQNGNGNVVAARAEGNVNRNNDSIVDCSKGRSRNPIQAEEFDLMAAIADLDEIEEVNANCILMANLQQASTSGTQIDKAPVYDLDRSVEVSCIEQGGGIVEQHPATVEETRGYQESLSHNLVAEVEKVNTVNCKMKETNVELTTELARYKNQEKCFEISQEEYDKLESSIRKVDPPVVYDSEETLELAQESRLKLKQLNKEIKWANSTKINHL
ncbi:hypothetical protein Tco_0158387 [Tanacetum coccineum]